MHKDTHKKRFSIEKRMVIIFGTLIIAALTLLGFLAIRRSRAAVMEKVEAHLFDKAQAAADLLDARIQRWFDYLGGISHMPELRGSSLSMQEKAAFLKKEADDDKDMQLFSIVDMNGILHKVDGSTQDVSTSKWFINWKQSTDRRYYSEPFHSRVTNSLLINIAVPILDENKREEAVLVASIDGFTLCNELDDITVGETGDCYIVGLTGTAIAHANQSKAGFPLRGLAGNSDASSIPKVQEKTSVKKSIGHLQKISK